MTKSDPSYLQLHRGSWRVFVRVPPHLRGKEYIGKANLTYNLGKVSLTKANTDKREHVDRFLKMIASAQRQFDGAESLTEIAYRKRLTIPKEQPGGLIELADHIEEVEHVRKDRGEKAARTYDRVARGDAVPVAIMKADWLASIEHAKYRHEAAKAFSEFESYLETHGKNDLKTLSGDDVEAWRDHLRKKLANGTINKKLTCISGAMTFLVKRKALKANPVTGLWLDKKVTRKRRRFTADEISALFKAADSERRDIMSVALLGLRISEQYTLKASDFVTEDGVMIMHVRGTKSESSDRRLPVPDLMVPMFRRLIAAAKIRDGYLFSAPPPAKLKNRGEYPAKRLRLWMAAVGMGDEVDWHSWRRTCAWTFEKALVPESSAARWLGHSGVLGLSYGLYSGQSDLKLLKAAVDQAVTIYPAEVIEHLSDS